MLFYWVKIYKNKKLSQMVIVYLLVFLEGTKKLGKGAIFTKDADSDSDIGKK